MKILPSILLLSIVSNLFSQTPNPKRGLSFDKPAIQVEDIQAMSGKISWYYNWKTKPESNVAGILSENNVEFIPMAWDEGVNIESLRSYYTDHPEAKYLLGFNEPNFLYQAGLTPTDAAAEWPKLEAIAEEFGLEIVGPAVNWCGDCVSEGGTTYYSPFDYYDDFFTACPDCRVDYIAVHNYMCYSSALVSYLEDFKKYNKKIWLTEYACWDQSTITLSMQKNLMYGSLDYMDNDTMIYKYAWFMGRSGSGTPHIDIFTSEGGVPTELGEIYLNFNSTHDTSFYASVPGRIEAESYSAGFGVQLEATDDLDGIVNVGYIDGGDWLQYNIEVSEAGDYNLFLRLAANGNTSANIWIDDDLIKNLNISSTGGWQNWTTVKIPVTLASGKSKIKITTSNGGFNLNWISVSATEFPASVEEIGSDGFSAYPNPVGDLLTIVLPIEGEHCTVEVVSTSGQILYTKLYDNTPKKLELDFSSFKSGIYFVRLRNDDSLKTLRVLK